LFDFMPLELGTVRGFKTRFHLYTVPGQVFYDASRKSIGGKRHARENGPRLSAEALGSDWHPTAKH
jgi:hypothetical protein